MIMRLNGRIAAMWICLALGALLLGCVTLPFRMSPGTQASAIPRWACPTPTPQPYGETGPVKGYQDGTPDPISGTAQPQPIYYEQWEQEDFDAGGAPFPAPTPYTKTGSSFYLGQLVNLTPLLDIRTTVRRSHSLSGGQRLYLVKLEWKNRGQPFAFSPARQVLISTIERPDGTRISGNGWGWSRDAALAAGDAPGSAVLEAQVPAGTSELELPILAPDGEAHTIALQLDLPGSEGNGGLRIQWTQAHEPHCGQDGTEAAVYPEGSQLAQVPGAQPAAADAVLFAAQQLGRPYCWGGKGWDNCDGFGGGTRQVTPSCSQQGGAPCWDCSGLTWGAYKAANTAIGQGTANQSQYPAVWRAGDRGSPAELAQPGDLLLFTSATANGRPAGQIGHVGIYAGSNLMIHAANYPDGVIQTPNVFSNHYYAARLALITRPVPGK